MGAQAGVWNFDGQPVDRGFLAKLDSAIERYGPDGGNAYSNGSLGMVYRAFHTTGESRLESQPYTSGRGNVITWDGRLDNRDDLIGDLQDELGSEPTDVAIVMAAYEKWSTNCFPKLIGDWALSIWDFHEQVLVLARDYVGIRHLYYHSRFERVLWCTNLEALVRLSKVKLTLNEEYIAGFLAFWPEAHLTPYCEIHAVPPGEFVRIFDGKAIKQLYWVLNTRQAIRYKRDAEYEEHFRHAFRQAVRRRLRTKSPILAELSGGLDSSSIVCMADDIIAEADAVVTRLETLSFYDANEPGGDERPYFFKVEERRGRPGHHFDLGDFSNSMCFTHQSLSALPGSIGIGKIIETEIKALKLREGFRVLLSGIGGDEFLGGVPDPRPQLADLVVQGQLLTLLNRLMAWSLEKRRPWVQLLYETVQILFPASLRVFLTQSGKDIPWANGTFARRHRLAARRLGPLENFGSCLPSRRDHARTLEVLRRQLASAALVPADYEERRYPYLDRDLVEFLTSIPPDQLLRPGERRSLMRRALANLLPPEVLERRTKAVSARRYIASLQMQWGSFQGLLKHPLAARLGYVNQSALQDALSVARAGDGSSLVLLQKAVSLENWLRNIAQYGVVNLEAELDLHERKLGLLKGKSQGLRTFFGMTSMKKNLISPRKVREE